MTLRTLRNSKAAFTLLEVILAVMILGLVAVGMFQFVRSTLRAIQYSQEDTEEVLSLERLVALVQEELYNLPVRGSNVAILGEALRTGNKDFDTLEWPSRGGPGLMTAAASGEYRVKLMMRPLEGNSNKYEIGLRRRPVMLDTAGGLIAGGSDATWVPLLSDTTGLRIRYWDPRMGQLLDSWREQGNRPTFVVLSILKEGENSYYEAVLPVPAAMTQQ
jgi:prepilin-type N-terminal cleavage/methylation domain-containing protein